MLPEGKKLLFKGGIFSNLQLDHLLLSLPGQRCCDKQLQASLVSGAETPPFCRCLPPVCNG